MKHILNFFIAIFPLIALGQINTIGTSPQSLTISPKGISNFTGIESSDIILGNGNITNDYFGKIAIGKKAGAGTDYSIVGIGNSALEFNTQGNVIGIGVEAGKNNAQLYNIFIGDRAGKNYQTNYLVHLIGYNALLNTKKIGYVNAIGAFAVSNLADSVANIYYHDALGFEAIKGGNSRANNIGNNNLAMGARGLSNVSFGKNNTALGYSAGLNVSSGDNNIFIGHLAGSVSNINNKLFISNSATPAPLIRGDLFNNNLSLKVNSKLQIGGSGHNSDNTLDVRGNFILAGRSNINSSVNNNYNLNGKSVIYVSDGGGTTYDLSGIAGGKDGLVIHLVVSEGGNLNILEQSSLSLTGNRIITNGVGTLNISNGGAATLIYDAASLSWRLMSIRN